VFRLGVACVTHGKTEESELSACFAHQRRDGNLAAHDLIFDLLQGEVVDIGMRVGVISEIESTFYPFPEYPGSGRRAERLNSRLDYETCYRNVMDLKSSQ